MQLKIGSYACDANTSLIAMREDLQFNEADQPYSRKRSLDVQGYLSGASQSALVTAENALQVALRKTSPDVVFLTDSGGETGVSLKKAGSITGVRITNFAFPRTTGPEYATERYFTFTAEAEYPLTGTTTLLMSFTETLSFSGGGPLYTHLQAIYGPPQKQLLYEATTYQVTQSGQAVGYLAYPNPAPPIWPQALKQAPRFSQTSPKRRGNGYQDFAVSWEYQFESASPLAGLPNIWR